MSDPPAPCCDWCPLLRHCPLCPYQGGKENHAGQIRSPNVRQDR